jgi:hypothetical protein
MPPGSRRAAFFLCWTSDDPQAWNSSYRWAPTIGALEEVFASRRKRSKGKSCLSVKAPHAALLDELDCLIAACASAARVSARLL